MIDVLNIKLDDIEDVQTQRTHREQQQQINPLDHYEVEAHGVTLLSTEKRDEAIRIYRGSQDTEKRVIKIWQGLRYQYLPKIN